VPDVPLSSLPLIASLRLRKAKSVFNVCVRVRVCVCVFILLLCTLGMGRRNCTIMGRLPMLQPMAWRLPPRTACPSLRLCRCVRA